MAPTTVKRLDIDSEGQKSLEALRRAINQAAVKKTENGNVQYSNRSLDTTVAPLLKSLQLDVSAMIWTHA
jgi:hypothetical protein